MLFSTSDKPWIALGGDDNGAGYIMTPGDSPWQYNIERIVNEGSGNIVATVVTADVDGDGNIELFFPTYYSGKIFVFSWQT